MFEARKNSLYDATEGRVPLWDNYKAFLIFLVVTGHIIDLYAGSFRADSIVRNIIYFFHMPAFIFMSGMFGRSMLKREKAPVDRIAGFFLLYCFVKVFLYAVHLIAAGHSSFSLFNTSGLPWFVFAMAAWTLFAWLVRRFDSRLVLSISFLLALIVGYDEAINSWLMLSRIIVFFPFYYSGLLFDRLDFERILGKRAVKITAMIFVVLFIIVFVYAFDYIKFTIPLYSGQNPYSAFPAHERYGAICRFIWYCLAFCLIVSFAALMPSRRLSLTIIGKRSLQIYVFHYAFIYLYQEFFFISNPTVLQWMLLIIGSAIVTVMLSGSRLERFMNMFTRPEQHSRIAQ